MNFVEFGILHVRRHDNISRNFRFASSSSYLRLTFNIKARSLSPPAETQRTAPANGLQERIYDVDDSLSEQTSSFYLFIAIYNSELLPLTGNTYTDCRLLFFIHQKMFFTVAEMGSREGNGLI